MVSEFTPEIEAADPRSEKTPDDVLTAAGIPRFLDRLGQKEATLAERIELLASQRDQGENVLKWLHEHGSALHACILLAREHHRTLRAAIAFLWAAGRGPQEIWTDPPPVKAAIERIRMVLTTKPVFVPSYINATGTCRMLRGLCGCGQWHDVITRHANPEKPKSSLETIEDELSSLQARFEALV